MSGPLLCFALDTEARRLRDEPEAESGTRNGITLVKDGPLRVVLVLLNAGAALDDAAEAGPATVQILAGRVRFEARDGQGTLGPGTIVAIESGVPHAVTAEERSVVLLTLVAA
ncbi:MAG: cupin domain-containing protein [bacterium]|nr:cupin domain-containing protein [bacterium]